MLNTVRLLIFSLLIFSSVTVADDLVKVQISSHQEASQLEGFGVEPILRLSDGYLVLANWRQVEALSVSGLSIELLANDIDKNRLGLDNRRDEANKNRWPVVYEQDGLRLFHLSDKMSATQADGSSLIPIRNENLKIYYKEQLFFNKSALAELDLPMDLVDSISFDSVYSYLHTLQAFNGRLAGTQSNYAARDWILGQFQSFGYGNARLDFFNSYVNGSWRSCYNVIATKLGTVFPDRYIVIGAHHDAVEYSPGADDNGSGTSGVLEIARILANVETEMSFVFVTFDSEEQGLNGAWHYADDAAVRGDSIVCMLNMDMIGHISNNSYAEVMHGARNAYAKLWIEISQPVSGITGVLGGSAGNSDHYAFDQNGYDVLFASEFDFSTVYHSYRDSTTYINFDYLTRMVRVSAATSYIINMAPLPVELESVRDAGDGQSLLVSWIDEDQVNRDSFIVYYDTEPETGLDSVLVPGDQTSAMLEGLTEGLLYRVHVIAVDESGNRSIAYEEGLAWPYHLPAAPESFVALPEYRSIRLSWIGNNTELDFSHYTLVRDGEIMPFMISDTFYIDNDFDLGSDLHSYLIVAVDTDGNISDTVGATPTITRAATLTPGTLLAVNRSSRRTPQIVDEAVTGEFLTDALAGYAYDYYSDTAYGNNQNIELSDMLDYELIVLGGESGRDDDFGNAATFGGILDSLSYYLSIGGKVIIFGRWGNLRTGSAISDTIYFSPFGSDYGYNSSFHIDRRINYLTDWTSTTLSSDLIGSHSLAAGYPDLTWDSLATVGHSFPWVEVSGIPCPSFPIFVGGSPAEPLYSYDSKSNFAFTEGRTTGWRYIGSDYQYIFFEIPLSFMERSTAKAALQMAVSELLTSGPAAATMITPDTLDLTGSYPSEISVYLGNFSDGHIPDDIFVPSVLINGWIPASASVIEPSHPDFVGEVLRLDIETDLFLSGYAGLIDTSQRIYTASFRYSGDPRTHIVDGGITFISPSFIVGDANGDHNVNVGDAVYLINFVFKAGPPPDPFEAGDANCDTSSNVGDAVFIINFVFKGGPEPSCP